MKRENPIKLYVFDADGTLRGCTVPGQPCPNRAGEWELLPGVRERLSRIKWDERAGPHFAVASNQGGVGLGYFKEETARALLADTARAAFCVEPPAGAIEVCTHAPRAGCACRKPKGGMLVTLMRRFGARPDETLYVGDMETDRDAARAAGVGFMWAKDFFGWESVAGDPAARGDADETSRGGSRAGEGSV
jgi:histidinol-phosphate phosphatase family protein